MTVSFKNSVIGIPDIPVNTSDTQKIEVQDAGYIVPIEWGCQIPYIIDKSIIFPESIKGAIEYVSTVTDYSFVPRTNETNYILFKNGNGCFTTLGKGNSQLNAILSPVVIINISRYCDMYAIVHELGHIIGLSHMMQRLDRDDFITINENNIDPQYNDQFTKRNILSIGDFDFDSAMMYDRYSTSKNINPVFTTNIKHDSKIGGFRGYSIGDIKNINNKAYNSKCLPKSKPPPCNSTDIEFYDGDKISSFNAPNGYYHKITDTIYKSYNLYEGKQFTLAMNEKKLIWEIIFNDDIYAYTPDNNLFGTTGWYILPANLSNFQLIPEAKIKVRNCEWPNLAGYHVDVTFNFENFFYNNIVTLVGILLGLIVILLLALSTDYYITYQLKRAQALMIGPLSLLKRTSRLFRAKSVSLYKGIVGSTARRATI